MPESPHPTNDLLIALLNGRLRQRQVEPVTAHLERCEQCAGRLTQLESATPVDAFLQHVRQAVLPDVADETPSPVSGRWHTFLQQHPRFQILSLISHGSSGPVYLATDRLTARRVALKLVPAGPDCQERLEELSEGMRTHPHPRVIPTIHVEPVGSELLIANEYRAGVTLREVVCSRGRLTVAEAIPYAQQAAEALAHAHSRSLTHGDLQPTDWLLDETGIAIRGWERMRCRCAVLHDRKSDVAGFGRTILGLLVGQTTLDARSRLPWDELWSDTPGAVIEVLKAAARAEHESPQETATLLMRAASTRRWWHRWNPFRN